MKKILFTFLLSLSFYSVLEASCYRVYRFSILDGYNKYICQQNGYDGIIYGSSKGLDVEGYYCLVAGYNSDCGNPDHINSEDLPNGKFVDDNFILNPDPLGGKECRDLFQKDGVAYTCNPNTNESTPIENSDGVINDPEMGDVPNCNDGFSPVATQSGMTPGSGTAGMYNSWSCDSNSGTGNGGSGDEGTTPTVPDVPNSGVTTSENGTKSWSVGGTTYELTTDGTLTTTYADGTTSVKNLGSDYYNSGSSGGSSSGGTGGGGSGSNGNTTNETNSNQNNTPVDDTPASNSCQDSSLTLQEKMLCEMNAGMKKLNSESNTENSLNNLLKDLNNTSNTNATAINTNIKETNKKLDSIKALNENQLAEQKKANATLEKIKDSGNATELYTKVMNESLNKIVGDDSVSTPDLSSLKDSSSWIDGVLNEYTTFYNNLKNSNKSFETFADNAKQTINQGFSFNLSSNQLVNCPIDYTIDLSSLKRENININIDFCEQTSKLRPFLYPFILIILFIAIIYLAFSFIRGL